MSARGAGLSACAWRDVQHWCKGVCAHRDTCTQGVACVGGTHVQHPQHPALPAALEYTLEADKDRHPPRVRFLGTHSATYLGLFPMPETRCESKELLLLVSVRTCVCTLVCVCAWQVALHVALELGNQLPGDGERDHRIPDWLESEGALKLSQVQPLATGTFHWPGCSKLCPAWPW